MGMTCYLRAIAPEMLEELIADQGMEDESWLGEPDTLFLEKSWEGLLLTLTGSDKRTESPLSKALLGKMALEEGDEFNPEDDIYLGFTYYLEADEVQEAWEALSEIPPGKIKKSINTLAFEESDSNLAKGDEYTHYILAYYKELRDYYKKAAKKGNAMIMTMV